MKNAILKKLCITFLLPLFALSSLSAKPNSKKLQIFILAGQSNMVGRGNGSALSKKLLRKV